MRPLLQGPLNEMEHFALESDDLSEDDNSSGAKENVPKSHEGDEDFPLEHSTVAREDLLIPKVAQEK